MAETEASVFVGLPDDVVLNILFKLEEDPRHWARLACVCTKFSSLVRNVCWKEKCLSTIPSVVADLLSGDSPSPAGGWPSLHKLAVCCPGLRHSGVLLEHSDFGLHRELGPDEIYLLPRPSSSSSSAPPPLAPEPECSWSLYDDLLNDTLYNASETLPDGAAPVEDTESPEEGESSPRKRMRKTMSQPMRAHLASGAWSLSREQGIKLLASRFRDDLLYICDWPGCVHIEEKRNYMLFRGVFKNFKSSKVWRNIGDGNRPTIDLDCPFCSCDRTWDLHSSFCLRRGFGYHDDGEPVVRAYVCENGHVSGAWTDLPLYT